MQNHIGEFRLPKYAEYTERTLPLPEEKNVPDRGKRPSRRKRFPVTEVTADQLQSLLTQPLSFKQWWESGQKFGHFSRDELAAVRDDLIQSGLIVERHVNSRRTVYLVTTQAHELGIAKIYRRHFRAPDIIGALEDGPIRWRDVCHRLDCQEFSPDTLIRQMLRQGLIVAQPARSKGTHMYRYLSQPRDGHLLPKEPPCVLVVKQTLLEHPKGATKEQLAAALASSFSADLKTARYWIASLETGGVIASKKALGVRGRTFLLA